MSIVLVLLFFATALLYASVGFGGGSTYNALLVLAGVDYRVLPLIALTCNIIVVAGGVWRFGRAGALPLRALAPFLIASAPAAWIGGRLPISETVFVGLLGFSLLATGLHLAVEGGATQARRARPVSPFLAVIIGAAIGVLSGLVGIGGGIFLAPALYLLHWGSPRTIAAAASLFIFVNSIAGLIGQTMKLGGAGAAGALTEYGALMVAVLIGGQIGSRLAATRLPQSLIKRVTAALILLVAIRLLWRWLTTVI